MNRFVMGLVLMVGVAGSALAADPDAGKALTLTCSACHGADGNSVVPTFPKLAGQNERYLAKQIMDIKSGARPVPTMVGQVDNFSDEDIANVAAFYAGQPMSGGKAAAGKAAQGASVYRGGVSETGVPACAGCHGARGSGNAPAGYPRLAGQHADYIAGQLRAYRTGAENTLEENASGRTNDGDARMMRSVALRLTDKEIDAVASFISGLY